MANARPSIPLEPRRPRPAWPRRRALAALVAAVLALHALVLIGWPVGSGDAWRREGLRPLQVRQIVDGTALTLDRPGRATEFKPVAPLPPAEVRARGPNVSPRAQVAAGPASTAGVAQATTDSGLDASHDNALAAAPAIDSGGLPAPVYATEAPPSATLRYQLRRAGAQGMGELQWHHDGSRYALSLLGWIGGVEAFGWVSRGGFDRAGLAPERMVVRRRGRALQAVNFQRDAGRVTFSGPSIELPLAAGAQDRVSWMLQLAAIVQATPALGAEGSQLSMWVIGARGDAELWSFDVQPRMPLELAERRIDGAVHLLRAPRRPYDLQAEVWLDPAQHHLPVRALLRLRPSGESTEFVLRELQLP